jgi:hypothetical protein
LRTAIWVAKEEDAHGRSRPETGTGRGLPPNVSYECWPTASDPQSTSTPAAYDGISAAAPPFQALRLAEPPRGRPVRSTCRWISALEIVFFRPNHTVGTRCGNGAGPPPLGSATHAFQRNPLMPTARSKGSARPPTTKAGVLLSWGPPSGALLRLDGGPTRRLPCQLLRRSTPKWYYMEVAAWSYHSHQPPNRLRPAVKDKMTSWKPFDSRLVVFESFFFSFPHIPSNLLPCPWRVTKVRAPDFILRPDFLYAKRHNSPRLTKPKGLGIFAGFLADSEQLAISGPMCSMGSTHAR